MSSLNVNLDIDECKETACDPNAKCKNVPGTFSCSCLSGFTENGTNCVGKFGTDRRVILK